MGVKIIFKTCKYSFSNRKWQLFSFEIMGLMVSKNNLQFYEQPILISWQDPLFLQNFLCHILHSLNSHPEKTKATYKATLLKSFQVSDHNSSNPLVLLTPAALSCICAFSSSFNSMDTISSIPFRPKITGTPIQRSFNPYSPSNNIEQGNNFF